MHDRRLKIFALLCTIFAAICIVRLGYIQLSSNSAWQSQLANIRTGMCEILPTLRGNILDRNGKILATDEAKFAVCIDYKFARLADERFWRARILKNAQYCDAIEAEKRVHSKYAADFNSLNEIIYKCAHFKNVSTEQITKYINEQINEPIWKLRYYLAWKRKYPKQKFELAEPDSDKRLLLAYDVDIAEMHNAQELFKLDNDDMVLAAQLEFINTDGIRIEPSTERYYPYKNLACQLIGWVRPAGVEDNKGFLQDELERYMHGDFAGYCGIEYICEPYLRGRRGRIIYNIDKEVISRTETLYGDDVRLTIDIDLQGKIEKILENKNVNPMLGSPVAIVVIDVNSTDILAMVSVPDFDLNTVRWDYEKLLSDANSPLVDRTINKNYPPGSTAKPIILAAGLAEKKITTSQIISCPSHRPSKGWPRCWIERTYGYGHDESFAYEGGNIARNALKGSCNIYFSQLATRIAPQILQMRLYDFGFGTESLEFTASEIVASYDNNEIRNFRQSAGIISSSIPSKTDVPLEQLPPISSAERRFFGIGQGNFRATVLQVANAFAAFARKGIYRKAKIFADQSAAEPINLNLDDSAINAIFEGLHAVVSEQGGTAYSQFRNSGFEDKGVKVYGKTGSTQSPANGWFVGFAKDTNDNAIAFAVLVEGAQHGGSDAGPIGRDVVSLCIESGYLNPTP